MVTELFLLYGMFKVDLLQELKGLKKAISLGEWENEQCQLRIRHATDELKHIQLVHISKEMQVRFIFYTE